jgi:hypothetical protein
MRLKVGDVVTLDYERYARRLAPVSPKISRVRTDVAWGDVVREYRQEIHKKRDGTTANRIVFIEIYIYIYYVF